MNCELTPEQQRKIEEFLSQTPLQKYKWLAESYKKELLTQSEEERRQTESKLRDLNKMIEEIETEKYTPEQE